jgi:sarcosine oxidase subunit beta
MTRAIQYALDLLPRLSEEASIDTGFRRTGSLFVALEEARVDALPRQVEAARENGVDATMVDASEVRRLAPDMDTSKVLAGCYVRGDGYVQPERFARAYAAAAQQRGVRIELQEPVTGLEIGRGHILGVRTKAGVVHAARVVLAAGPWSGALVRRAGFTAPVQPIRHQRVRTAPPATAIPEHHPVVRVPDLSCYLRPEQGGYLYGFFEPQPVSFNLDDRPGFRTADLDPPVEVMDEARRRLAGVFPVLERLDVLQRHQGLTTFTPDGSYVIGPVPGVDGLFVAGGCAALGIAGSAAVGRWLARWVVIGDPGDDLTPFAPERFAGRIANWDRFRADCEAFYASYYAIH